MFEPIIFGFLLFSFEIHSSFSRFIFDEIYSFCLRFIEWILPFFGMKSRYPAKIAKNEPRPLKFSESERTGCKSVSDPDRGDLRDFLVLLTFSRRWLPHSLSFFLSGFNKTFHVFFVIIIKPIISNYLYFNFFSCSEY